jgi:thiamine pyrophosphate-dependent acetolactate synthase large subunit-like protein
MGTVAEFMVSTLKTSGVRRVYGIPGDSLNGFTDALRRDGGMAWEHVRHEEAAAFAATGEATLTGELAVCAGSCGPGNLHLINGLFDANRSRVPVLAIAAHIPREEIGGNFQETHPRQLFGECSVYCELSSVAEQVPRILRIAMRTALQRRGVAVVVIPECSSAPVAAGWNSAEIQDLHHQTTPTLVPLVNQIRDVGVNLRLQRGGQHPPRTLTHDLVQQRSVTDRLAILDHYGKQGRTFPTDAGASA